MANSVSVRIAIIGDAGVGKSSLISRYCMNTFSHEYQPTIGIEFRFKHLKNTEIGDIKAQFWDMSGRENFKSLRNQYLPGAHGVIIGFDVTDPVSVNNAFHYMDEIESKLKDESPMFCFVALKAENAHGWDLDESKYKHTLYYTSAKRDIGVLQSLDSFVISCAKNRADDPSLLPNELIDVEDDSEDEPSFIEDLDRFSAKRELITVRKELAEMKAERSTEQGRAERTLLLKRIVQLGDREAQLVRITKSW